MNNKLTLLPPYDEDNNVNVVVEAPKGCALKLEYSDKHGVFTVSRSLPLGMSYPFDWGFVPGTRAADGDPVDAMAIHQTSSYPGVVLPCRLLGMVELEQSEKGGKWEVNNRLIAIPAWHEGLQDVQEARDLPSVVRKQIEQFFVDVTQFTGKRIRIRGWGTRKKTQRFLEASRAAK